MPAKPTDNRLNAFDFSVGLAWAFQQRVRHSLCYWDPNGMRSFHLAFENAYCHLEHLIETGEVTADLRFVIRTDLHSLSEKIEMVVSEWVYLLRIAVWRDRTLTLHKRPLDHLLETNPIPAETYLMLADEFLQQLRHSWKEQPWTQAREERYRQQNATMPRS